MEKFDSKRYRDNLAKDLKNIRKTDPEMAEKILEDEKGKIHHHDSSGGIITKVIRDEQTTSARYKIADNIHKTERKSIQENSPVLKKAHEENVKMKLEENIEIGMDYKPEMLNHLDMVDEKFSEIEEFVLNKIHSLLQKEKNNFVYNFHAGDHQFFALLNGEPFYQDVHGESIPSKLISSTYIENNYAPNSEGYNRFLELTNREFKAFYLPEFQEEIDGEKLGIIKTKNLYFTDRYATEKDSLLFSRSKEALIDHIKTKMQMLKK